jgi:hypothetical protein
MRKSDRKSGIMSKEYAKKNKKDWLKLSILECIISNFKLKRCIRKAYYFKPFQLSETVNKI